MKYSKPANTSGAKSTETQTIKKASVIELYKGRYSTNQFRKFLNCETGNCLSSSP